MSYRNPNEDIFSKIVAWEMVKGEGTSGARSSVVLMVTRRPLSIQRM